MKMNAENCVVVFDLDDTLYQEEDYFHSGVNAVAAKLEQLYKIDARRLLSKLISGGEADLWGAVCEELKLPIEVKESLLWEYRLHSPSISLRRSVQNFIDVLKKKSSMFRS